MGIKNTVNDAGVERTQILRMVLAGLLVPLLLAAGVALATQPALAQADDAAAIDPGTYVLENVANGRYLDADQSKTTGTSFRVRDDDQFEITALDGGSYNLRSVAFGTYLDEDSGSTEVGLSTIPKADDEWKIESAGDGTVFLTSSSNRRISTAVRGPDIALVSGDEAGRNARWILVPAERGISHPLVGSRISLQNRVTGRWLEANVDGSVNQSVDLMANEEWLVTDAGGGFVYLTNWVTGDYLDADQGTSTVDTSSFPARDDRWILDDDGEFAVLRNVTFRGYLHGLGAEDGYAVAHLANVDQTSDWTIVPAG